MAKMRSRERVLCFWDPAVGDEIPRRNVYWKWADNSRSTPDLMAEGRQSWTKSRSNRMNMDLCSSRIQWRISQSRCYFFFEIYSLRRAYPDTISLSFTVSVQGQHILGRKRSRPRPTRHFDDLPWEIYSHSSLRLSKYVSSKIFLCKCLYLHSGWKKVEDLFQINDILCKIF